MVLISESHLHHHCNTRQKSEILSSFFPGDTFFFWVPSSCFFPFDSSLLFPICSFVVFQWLLCLYVTLSFFVTSFPALLHQLSVVSGRQPPWYLTLFGRFPVALWMISNCREVKQEKLCSAWFLPDWAGQESAVSHVYSCQLLKFIFPLHWATCCVFCVTKWMSIVS